MISDLAVGWRKNRSARGTGRVAHDGIQRKSENERANYVDDVLIDRDEYLY